VNGHTEHSSNTITVLVVKPGEEPQEARIEQSLASLQSIVGGRVRTIDLDDDPVAITCNEEGKIDGLPSNRALHDENGDVYDIIAGTFIVSGLGEENLASLSPGLKEKYMEQFRSPEVFVKIAGKILAVKTQLGPHSGNPSTAKGEER
jgi:hypothetical protein